ncbi:hypothetical protein AB4306_18290 [Vibrio splendidus]|uniref:hypothetical protein n=1 Tax=Vibrio splendidus TaxID=29497 RepID=UPI00076A44DC|nr:hypothetical protein [Vibrio splendidus]PHX05510.1 hypothetical protein VSPL_29040 [Vibrio splendidus]
MGKKNDEQKETKYQKELAKVAANQWNDYQDTFVPVENEYIRRTKSMGDKSQYDKVSGNVNTSFNSSYDEAGKQVDRGLAAAGVNPASGKASGAQTNLIEDKLGKENQTTSAGQHNATQRYTGNMKNVVAIGKGQEAQATAGLQDISAASGRKASSDAIAEANKVSLPAAAVGLGASTLASNPEWTKNAYNVVKGGLSNATGGTTMPADNNVGYGLANA